MVAGMLNSLFSSFVVVLIMMMVLFRSPLFGLLAMLPLIDFTVQPPDKMWRYLNAFLGSRQYGELALKYAVRYSISGHVHYRRQVKYKNTTFICSCLNYAGQWVDNEDPVVEVKRALKTIDI